MKQGNTTALRGERVAAPSLPVFLACHCAAGIVAGWIMVGGLLWLDVAGLGVLVMASDMFPVPLLMLLAAFAITFGAMAMGSAIMGLGRSGSPVDLTGRGRPLPARTTVPTPIRAARRRL
jgi:hypothetical protein